MLGSEMLGNLIPKSALMGGLVGFAAVYMARKIGPIEKILDGTLISARPNKLPLPDLATSPNGFPLVYAVAPAALAVAIHKFL